MLIFKCNLNPYNNHAPDAGIIKNEIRFVFGAQINGQADQLTADYHLTGSSTAHQHLYYTAPAFLIVL